MIRESSSDNADSSAGPQADISNFFRTRTAHACRRLRHWFEVRSPQLRAFFAGLFPGRVSHTHYHEAKERYWSIRRLVEYESRRRAAGASTAEADTTLQTCEEILRSDLGLLTRRQSDLSRLWSSLTRMRLLLMQSVFDDEQLAAQISICREEAYRLGVEADPAVVGLLGQAAETMDEEGKLGEKRPRLLRCLKATFERLNSIRVSQIHQQYQNIWIYQFALIVLVALSAQLLYSPRVFIQPTPPLNDETSETAPVDSDVAKTSLSQLSEAAPSEESRLVPWVFWESLVEAFARVNGIITGNVLAFVFFAGLAGGFFSVVIRAQRQPRKVSRQDVYGPWYILTKPVVGALGAVIVFILIRGGFEIVDAIQNVPHTPGARLFGIAFISGFSERFVFRNLSLGGQPD